MLKMANLSNLCRRPSYQAVQMHRSLFTSNNCNCYKGDPEENALRKYMLKNNLSPEYVQGLTQHGMDETDVGGRYGANKAEEPSGDEKHENLVWRKIIEKKNFSDLYKIKPGEVYSRKKDPYFKNNQYKDYYHPHHMTENNHKKLNSLKSNYKSDIDKRHAESPLNIFHDMPSDEVEKETEPIQLQVITTKAKFNPQRSKKERMPQHFPSPSDVYGKHQAHQNNSSAINNKPKSMLFSEPDYDNNCVPEALVRANMQDGNASKNSNMNRAGTAVNNKHVAEETSKSTFDNYDGPNLLLWSMKEQIRYLHHMDAVCWSPDAIATIFPVSTDTVKKLLKSKWKPQDEAALQKHDKEVIAQWRQFTKGKIGSEALVLKALAMRSSGHSTSAPLPAVTLDTEQMMAMLDGLIFDEPDSAKRLGVSRSSPNLETKVLPRHGYFVDIIAKYNRQVGGCDDKRQSEDETRAPLRPEELSEVLPRLDAEDYQSEKMVNIKTATDDESGNTADRRQIKTRWEFADKNTERRLRNIPLMTYDQFRKLKNGSNSSTSDPFYQEEIATDNSRSQDAERSINKIKFF